MLHLSSRPDCHAFFEALGYGLGFAAYKRARRNAGDVLNQEQRWTVIAAAAVGGLLGSRILGVLEQTPGVHISWTQLLLPMGGKTIVGGLLGGWIGVELAKKLEGITRRTGDLFAIPLCIGIAVGRVGCLLAGLVDDTYGSPTSLPWGVDFGDGIARHPTQAYEILFLSMLGVVLHWFSKRRHANGSVFRLFMVAYLSWRLLIDLLKPQPLVAGMNLIQWACTLGLLALAADLAYTRSQSVESVVQQRTHNAL